MSIRAKGLPFTRAVCGFSVFLPWIIYVHTHIFDGNGASKMCAVIDSLTERCGQLAKTHLFSDSLHD